MNAPPGDRPRGRDGSRSKVTLLEESGNGESYRHPAAGPQRYLKLPHAYLSEERHLKFGPRAKAMMMIAVSLDDGFVFPIEKAPEWCGISADTANRGIRLQVADAIRYRRSSMDERNVDCHRCVRRCRPSVPAQEWQASLSRSQCYQCIVDRSTRDRECIESVCEGTLLVVSEEDRDGEILAEQRQYIIR